jgi:hypothetical protein
LLAISTLRLRERQARSSISNQLHSHTYTMDLWSYKGLGDKSRRKLGGERLCLRSSWMGILLRRLLMIAGLLSCLRLQS